MTSGPLIANNLAAGHAIGYRDVNGQLTGHRIQNRCDSDSRLHVTDDDTKVTGDYMEWLHAVVMHPLQVGTHKYSLTVISSDYKQ